MRIYTKTGDGGETSLLDQSRVAKSDARVEACGEVDELNACLGVVAAAGVDADLDAAIEQVQKDLFVLGARLADPSDGGRVSRVAVGHEDVARLEHHIDRLESELPVLRRFILPGGGPIGAQLHVARAVCRRAERRVVSLGAGAVDAFSIVYLNRLSDLLFVMARVANHRARKPEIEWRGRARRAT